MSEVVKCKDCYCFYHDDSWNSKSGYCQWFCTPTGINDFCSHGETPRHADIGGELPKPENVVEVVWCKDCRNCEGSLIRLEDELFYRCRIWRDLVSPYGYCYMGDRKEVEK